MWRISLRDLVWRRRRLGIAVFGASVVMAMALLTSGVGAAFTAEAQRTIDAAGGNLWLVPSSAPGAFNTPPIASIADAQLIASTPGVRAADPLTILSQSLQQPSGRIFIEVLGYRVGGLARLPLQQGRLPSGPDEAVADASLKQSIGSRLAIGTHRFTVVGISTGLTLNGGIPDVWVSITDLDAAEFRNQPVANALVVSGRPATQPAGYRALEISAVLKDELLPTTQAVAMINILEYLFWVVAALIVAAFVYLSTNERRRDFAVLKAIGVSSRSLGTGVIIQATSVAIGAAAVSAVLAFALSPLFPIEVAIPPIEYAILPVGALIIGLLASLIALRRIVSLDPALAFAGAA